MPSRFRSGRIVCLVVGLALAATVSAAPSRTLDRIKSEATIHLGFRSGAAPFSFKERNGIVRGYSVELCTRIVAAIQKQLGLPKLAVDWTPLDASDRLDAVASGKVDIECGTTTIALSRMELVDFSLPIFVLPISITNAWRSSPARQRKARSSASSPLSAPKPSLFP